MSFHSKTCSSSFYKKGNSLFRANASRIQIQRCFTAPLKTSLVAVYSAAHPSVFFCSSFDVGSFFTTSTCVSGNMASEGNPKIIESGEQQSNTRSEFFEIPSKPRALEIAFSSENDVFLKWNSPETDGSSPITKYFVEVLDKVGDWRQEKVIPANQEITSIRNLEPGRVYQFRVRAVNEAGVGEPSNITPFAVAKPKGYAPKIYNDTFRTVKIEVGDSYVVERGIDAEPSAVVTWQLDERLITNEDRVRITYKNCRARIEIRKCKKSDSGIYSITAKNEFARLEQQIFRLVVEDGVFRKLGKAALITAGASAAILGGIPLVVSGLGFTAGGVAAGSMAAAYQSAFLGGTIASGSAFATLQSIGAAGLAASTQAGIVGATGATSLAAVFSKKEPKK